MDTSYRKLNIDGIKKSKNTPVKKPVIRAIRFVKVDAVTKRLVENPGPIVKKTFQPVVNSFNYYKPSSRQEWAFISNQKRVPVLVAVIGVLLAFGAGSWSVLSTNKSEAEVQQPQVLGALTQTASTENNLIPVASAPVASYKDPKVSNAVILSLTLDQIEGYLNDALKTPEVKKEEILAIRKAKLKIYLAEKKSPFVSIVDTIAELKHWKLVLAISNSESTLGKRCYTNNCSGIGVEPGHPLWREYATKADWAKDLDRLIERRYKDWKLEEMNGVYNQPGSANWIYAATQIIEDLKEREIE